MVTVEIAILSDQVQNRVQHSQRALAASAQKRGLRLRRVKRKLLSQDPQRRAILSRLRVIWRHRPKQGILLFFDVKVIAVKAYGGRRYTAAKQLVLAQQQKTRGKFYLFLLYEVNSGRTHWAFMPGKSSNEVCQFMKRVRRWYPTHEVWIALDQDRSHPLRLSRFIWKYPQNLANPVLR
jgi:hypothetical protein